jgi:hypothetical protein
VGFERALSPQTTVHGGYRHDALGHRLDGGATHRFDNGDVLTGAARLGHLDGQTSAGVNGKLASEHAVYQGAVSGGLGVRNHAEGHGLARLPLGDNLYSSAYGRAAYHEGQQTTADLGAAVTWLTPDQKHALTLAGAVDLDGNFDLRFQYHLFKKRVRNVRDLDAQQRKALSLFLEYNQAGHDGGPSSLHDDVLGGASHDTKLGDQSQLRAGIRIRF